MDRKPVLSVIVPVYNTGSYISRCVESILSQTLKNIEIILIDDGSTDTSAYICDKYADSYYNVYVIHQKNMGQFAARKVGFETAHADYIACVDSDDIVESDMYETLIMNMKNADVVMTGMAYDDEDGKLLGYTDDINETGYYTRDSVHIWHLVRSSGFSAFSSMCTKIYCRNIACDVAKNINVRLTWMEDLLFNYLYVLQCSKISVQKSYKYHKIRNIKSITNQNNYNLLLDFHNLYHAVLKAIVGHPWEKVIENNFQRDFQINLFNFLGAGLNISKNIRFPNYCYPLKNKFSGKNIVLYGAGVVGIDYFYLFNKLDPPAQILWVDKNKCGELINGKDICTPEEIIKWEYDYVVCAVKNEDTFREIRNNLLKMGIEKDKILWKAPVELFVPYDGSSE